MDQATVLESPGTSNCLYFLFARRKPCWAPAESMNVPTISPLSLIPSASVSIDLGTVSSVSFPFAYISPTGDPVLLEVHQPTATPAELIPYIAIAVDPAGDDGQFLSSNEVSLVPFKIMPC